MKHSVVFMICISSLCFSSCTRSYPQYIREFRKIIKNNVRYLVTDDAYYADCFIITPDKISDGVCYADFKLFAWDDKPTSFGRVTGFKNKDSNLYDMNDDGYLSSGQICLRFVDFDSYKYIPLVINIKIFIDQPVLYNSHDQFNIYYWIPDCNIKSSHVPIRKVNQRIEIHMWNNYEPDPDSLIKDNWNGNYWSFDNNISFYVFYTDAPKAEVAYYE